MLIGCRETLVRDRARGLVGYDVALTRRRSPVRIRPGPWYFKGVFLRLALLNFFSIDMKFKIQERCRGGQSLYPHTAQRLATIS